MREKGREVGMRLIDADALKADWKMGDKCEECDCDARSCQYEDRFSRMDVCGMIDEAPTIDATRITYCKDCIHFEPENAEEGDSYGRCRNNYAPCQNQQVEMMWFCADGER